MKEEKKRNYYILDQFPLFSIENKNHDIIRDFYWCVCYEDNEVRVFDKAQGKLYGFEQGKKYLEDLYDKYPASTFYIPYYKSYEPYMSYDDCMFRRSRRNKYIVADDTEEEQ